MPTTPTFPDQDGRNPLADDCRRCSALAESRECIAWGNGPLDASLVVVGEAPAAGDPEARPWSGGNHTGMAYTSRRSGRKIRNLVADIGFEGAAYYTNAVKCFPADDGDASNSGDSIDNREPTATERANCRPYLVEEIRTVEPDAVLATGKHATKSVLEAEKRRPGGDCHDDDILDDDILDGGFPDDGFLDGVLEPVDCPALGTALVPLVHPSYQEVWIPRLGYDDREAYAAAIGSVLDGI